MSEDSSSSSEAEMVEVGVMSDEGDSNSSEEKQGEHFMLSEAYLVNYPPPHRYKVKDEVRWSYMLIAHRGWDGGLTFVTRRAKNVLPIYLGRRR